MAEIKLVEDYAITTLRNDVRDSLMMAGEQAILLQLYHPGDSDAQPCVECGDDIYKSPEVRCNSCYGTMFEGAVRVAVMVWSLYTDRPAAEKLERTGTYRPDARDVQMEAFPLVSEHDVIVRVSSWSAPGVPETVSGFYELQTVQQRSLRTGNRFGQSTLDVVGQKASLTRLSGDAGITAYPIIGVTFSESTATTPTSSGTPQTVDMPDVKVIYYPIETAPGDEDEAVFVFVQENPEDPWIIQHNLGYDPSVSTIVNNEEVDGDVTYLNEDSLSITFGTPLAGIARLT